MIRYALRFIGYDKAKSIGVIMGIVISTFLVGQQTGIFLFLTGSMSTLVDNSRAALWVVDNKTTNANALGRLDMRIGRQLESISGVRKAYPLITAGASAKFLGGKTAGITLVGSQAPEFRGGPWQLRYGSLTDLLEEGAVSTEYFDRKDLNDVQPGTGFEINGKRVLMTVQTQGARGFGAAYVFTTISRARELTGIPATKASAFLVDIEPGSDPAAVRDGINRTISGIRAWTKADFSKATVSTVLSTSGIAFSIGTLILFAAVSGVIIIGLTMYSAAVDRIRDYGTLKAIGADNRYVRRLILTQAMLFALPAFGLSVILIEGFRRGLANSGVIFSFGIVFRIVFFLMTIFIALGGALFATRRLSKVEPASVFRA